MTKKEKLDMIFTCVLSLNEYIDDQTLLDSEKKLFTKNLIEQWRRHINKLIEENK